MRSPAPWALGVLAGIGLQLQQAELGPQSAYGALAAVGLVLAVIAWRCPARPAWAASLRLDRLAAFLAALVLAFAQTGWRAAAYQAQALAPALEGQDIEVVGQIAASPQAGLDVLRFRLELEQAWLGDRVVALPPLIALSWYAPRHAQARSPWPDEPASEEEPQAQRLDDEASRRPRALQAGERWRMTVRLKAPHGLNNPQGFDQELRWWEQGVQAQGHVRTAARYAPPQRLERARGHWIERARQATRSAIARQVEQSALAGVIAALVMGDQQAIERADWDVFRATGVAHLMSISGLHITLFAWLAGMLLAALWRSSARFSPAACLLLPAHVAGTWGGLALACAYALYSGWGVPAQRTVLMLLIVVSLRSSARLWPWPHVWLLAMAAILALDPWAVLQAGFWLSFVAVALLFASDVGPAEPPALRNGAFRPLLVHGCRALVRLLREQWVMTLALAPLTLLLFQQVSLVGLLANVLAIPWVTLLVTPLALLGIVWPPAWNGSAWALEVLMALLNPLAQWPWAVMERPAAPWWSAAAGLLGGLLLVMRWPTPLRLLGLPLMLPVALWQNPTPAPGSFELLAFDVGQGTAVVVRTARHSLLYDAGPRYGRDSDAGARVLVPALRALGLRLDLLLLSHRDTDHIGGASALLAWRPDLPVMSSLPDEHALLRGRAGHQPCRAGQRWQWDGVNFEVLHPSAEFAQEPHKPNELSCVLRVAATGGQGSALLAGDLEARQEAELARRMPLQADLLLAPHHGSRTSSSDAMLDAVQPRWVLVQAGYRNRFGHPAPPVMERYAQRGIRVAQSASCGAATWRSAAPDQVLCERTRAPRYWHHRAGDGGAETGDPLPAQDP
ncbi:MAG: DNA internalization-related competence protein ComEC/Rec2 [Betaproteobacteria bacterium]